MSWWQNPDIMHLLCKWAWWTFFGTYSTYLLLQADSACKNAHKLVHDVVPRKYVLQGTYLFGWFVICKMVSPTSIFWSVLLSSVVQQTHSMWNSFVHLRVFRTHVNFYDPVHDSISNRIHNCTSNLFGWSRVWTPGLAHDLFCWSRVRFPDLAAWSFVGPGFNSRTRSPLSGP